MYDKYDKNDIYSEFDENHQMFNDPTPRKSKIKNHNTAMLFTSFFLFTLLIFCFIIGSIHLNTLEYKKNCIKAPAVITRIAYSSSTDSYSVYVEFIIDGITYDGKLNYYSSSMRTGDTHYIYYTPNNPSDFISASSATTIFLYIILIPTFICIGIELFLSYKHIKNFITCRNLIANGKKTTLTIHSFLTHYNIRLLGSNPITIVCHDQRKDIFYLTTRSFLKVDKFQVGTLIDIFIDENNQDVFYIDYKSYLQQNK